MFRECDKWEIILSGPKFNLSIVSSCGYKSSIIWVSKSIEIEEVTLLLEDISLGFPFPYKKLTLLFACEGNPFSWRINADWINFGVWYLETMNTFQGVNVEYSEHTVVLTDYHNSSLLSILSDSRTEFTGDYFDTWLGKIYFCLLFE